MMSPVFGASAIPDGCIVGDKLKDSVIRKVIEEVLKNANDSLRAPLLSNVVKEEAVTVLGRLRAEPAAVAR